jgi:hypothetical protein
MMMLLGLAVFVSQAVIMLKIFKTGILTNNSITYCNIRSVSFCVFLYAILNSILTLSAIIINVGGPDLQMIFDSIKAVFFASVILFSVLAVQVLKILDDVKNGIDGVEKPSLDRGGDSVRSLWFDRFNRWFLRLPL